VTAAGRELAGLVLDLDATPVTCHSEEEQAAPTYKGGFGFHPLLCFLVNTGEAVSGRLRPGNAGANTAADHIAVLDQALMQQLTGHTQRCCPRLHPTITTSSASNSLTKSARREAYPGSE
jgi:hypothetical protein